MQWQSWLNATSLADMQQSCGKYRHTVRVTKTAMAVEMKLYNVGS